MKLFSFLLCSLLTSSLLHAQNWSLGTNIFYDEALQEYGKNLDDNPVGLAISGLYSLPNSRLSIGGDIGIAMYYNDTYTEELSDKGYANSTAEVYEEDCYYNLNIIARYSIISYGPLNPYGEVRVGGSTYFTEKDYQQINGTNAPEQIESEFDVHGTSFKMGIGIGTTIDINKLINPIAKSLFAIDLGASLNNGTKTHYRSVEHSDIAISNSSSEHYSKTNNLVYRLGIVVIF